MPIHPSLRLERQWSARFLALGILGALPVLAVGQPNAPQPHHHPAPDNAPPQLLALPEAGVMVQRILASPHLLQDLHRYGDALRERLQAGPEPPPAAYAPGAPPAAENENPEDPPVPLPVLVARCYDQASGIVHRLPLLAVLQGAGVAVMHGMPAWQHQVREALMPGVWNSLMEIYGQEVDMAGANQP